MATQSLRSKGLRPHDSGTAGIQSEDLGLQPRCNCPLDGRGSGSRVCIGGAREMPRMSWTLALVLAWAGPLAALDNDRKQMQGLDEQVQEVKSDVLSISAELGRLEEKLLYPS